MKKSFFISLLGTCLLLTGCFTTIGGSDDSQNSGSGAHSGNHDSSTIIEDDDFSRLVANMRKIPMTNGQNPPPLLLPYDQTAPLGSPSNPVSGMDTCSVLSIRFFEQPTRYGDSMIIKCDESTIIMDMGTISTYNGGSETDVNAYKALMKKEYDSLNDLDLLIITHPHEDHLGAFDIFKSSFTNKEVKMIVDYGWTNTTSISQRYQAYRGEQINKGVNYCSIYNAINSKYGCSPTTYITPNLYINWLNTAQYMRTTSQAPSTEISEDPNATSLTGILNFNDFSYYFSGDLDRPGEDNVLSNDTLHPVTMMKASHHGSANGNSSRLLGAIKPEIIEISAGADMTTDDQGNQKNICSGHPYSTPVNNFVYSPRQDDGSENIYLTMINGTTTFYTKGRDYVYMEGSPRYRTSISGINYYDGSKTFTLYGPNDSTYIYSEMKETPYESVCRYR